MKEVLVMWKYGTMVALTVMSAGIYMLFLLPFKSVQIIPGITELRPATILPVVFGLLFGPAGAWGSAIGNLAGDMFGTLSIGSIFGFIGNFFFALIPYKLWGRMRKVPLPDLSQTINSSRKLIEFGLVSIIASISCAVIIAWGLDVLNMVPFIKLVEIIATNNIAVTLILGPILLPIAYRIAKKAGILWTDIMCYRVEKDAGSEKLNVLMIVTGAVGSLAAGVTMSLVFSGGQGINSNSGNLLADIIMLPFLSALVYGVSRC